MREAPIFKDLSVVSEETKSFYNDLFSVEGDIFKDCSIDRIQMRNMIVNGLFNPVPKLEKFTNLEVLSQTISEVAYIVAVAASMGVKVEWVDRILRKLMAMREQL